MKKLIGMLLIGAATLLQAGEYDLKTLGGKTIKMQNYDGNFVFEDPKYKKGNLVFFFFGTKCPYCEIDTPKVEKMVENGQIEVIGVEAQTKVDNSTLRRFVKKKGLQFAVLDRKSADRLINYLDSRRILPGTVPTYMWVDKYGNLEALDFKDLANIR